MTCGWGSTGCDWRASWLIAQIEALGLELIGIRRLPPG